MTTLTLMTTALRRKTRAAKHDLTTAALDLQRALADHLAAVRSETRAKPVYRATDSDRAIDALNRAFAHYQAAAEAAAHYHADETRAAEAVRILRKI